MKKNLEGAFEDIVIYWIINTPKIWDSTPEANMAIMKEITQHKTRVDISGYPNFNSTFWIKTRINKALNEEKGTIK
jgi:hypothetical protein